MARSLGQNKRVEQGPHWFFSSFFFLFSFPCPILLNFVLYFANVHLDFYGVRRTAFSISFSFPCMSMLALGGYSRRARTVPKMCTPPLKVCNDGTQYGVRSMGRKHAHDHHSRKRLEVEGAQGVSWALAYCLYEVENSFPYSSNCYHSSKAGLRYCI